MERTTPFSLGDPWHLLGSPCLLPEEKRLSMPETGEKERNYLFKSYTGLEQWLNVFITILKSFRIPTDVHSPAFFLCPVRGTVILGKEVEVHDSGSPHHQLCYCHGVPTLPKLHGPLLLRQSCVVLFPFSAKAAWSSLFSLPKLCDPLSCMARF